ncbi:MAG: cytochrome c3 family protein [Phycisphaerales bacterium]|nr:cytochrome c3 family protein [Phycisphaerales bacterium]
MHRYSLIALCLAGLAVAPLQAQDETPQAVRAIQTCAGACHQDTIRRKVTHGVTLEKCDACHVLTNAEAHTFSLTARPEDLCVRCHALPMRTHAHPPVAERACLKCHDPHGSDHPAMLLADPKGDLCARCHDRKQLQGDYVHGPVAVGACIVCHEPHASAEPALMRKPERETCLTCHAEVDRSGEADWHTHPALERGCTGCHSPHASNHKFQLKAEAPDLCLTCHEEKIHTQTADAKIVHGALHAPGGCTDCHEAHGSRLTKLQKVGQVEECLGCHNERLPAADGSILTNMKELLDRNPDHHGPIREGACTACHLPHAGDRFRMLVEDYPKQFYAPFDINSFKLCFGCHIPDLVLKENGRGLTNFRDGDRNLHWLHVNQEKGRTCRACHEVHASKRPAHIREAVPFGESGWMLEINFNQTEVGGSCSPGCHKQRSYVRHDDIKPPGPTTAAETTPTLAPPGE